MNIRRASEDDREAVEEMWRAYEAERDDPFPESWEEAWPDLARHIHEGVAFLAEDDAGPAGFLFATFRPEAGGFVHIVDLYVRPDVRRQGLAKRLMGEAVARGRERGAGHVSLEVLLNNAPARAVYERLGFASVSASLVAPLDALEQRVSRVSAGPSAGRVYVQTDDEAAVDRAVRQFIPRLGGSGRTEVLPAANGWVAIDDELCSRDPKLLRRLAQEMSDRTGAVVLSLGIEDGAVVRYILLERGRIADEYASLPEYHGPLPPGDVIALGANPTVARRLTGADPARIRAVARTASSPAELPPAEQLLAEIADVLGVG
jgi:ribosomal protein S18 acetylase RimI-like enzyme